MKRYKVTITNRGNIPGVGRGPFKIPIPLSQEKYESLVKLGYNVKIVSDLLENVKKVKTPKIAEKTIVAEPIKVQDEIVKQEEVVVEVPHNSEEKEVEQEEIPEEEVETTEEMVIDEELLYNNPDLDKADSSIYTEDFLTSKNLCKKILNARLVQYEDNASFAVLKKLVLETNPEIQEDETNE